MTDTTKSARIPQLDGIRGLAILLVFLLHSSGHGTRLGIDRAYDTLVGMGWAGVDLFFVLSGFLITGTLLDAKGKAGYLRNFYARRVLRIFPVYYATLVAAFLIVPRLAPDAGGEGFSWLRTHQWAFWLDVQNWLFAGSGWPDTILGHFWSLAIEEQFYLVWPLVVLLLSHRRLRTLSLVLFLTALALRIGVWSIDGLTPDHRHNLSRFSTFCRMDGLAAGGLLAVLAREASGLARYARFSLPVLTAACVAFLAAKLFDSRSGSLAAVDTVGLSALVVAFSALVVASTALSEGHAVRRAFCWKPLRFLGKYSYAMYIFHWPIIVLAGQWWSARVPVLSQAGFVFITGTATVLAALLSWHLLEQAFLSLKSRFGGNDHPSSGLENLVGDQAGVARVA